MMGSCKFLVFFIFFSLLQFTTILSVQFEVGSNNGWVLPKSKDDDQIYNQWASKNRFKVNDTLHFKYKKDSVLEVSDDEYEKCRSPRPLFFSNNGDTVYTLDRPGLFYFVSGVAGHCERGQKMIIKVLEPETPPSSSGNQNATDDTALSSACQSVEVAAAAAAVPTMMLLFIIM